MTNRSRLVLCGLVFAMGVFNAVVAWMFMGAGESFALPIVAAAAVLLLPSLVAIAWLVARPGRLPVGLAAGLGVINALEAVSMGSLLFLGAWNPGDAESVTKTIGVMVLPNAIVALIAIVMAFREYGVSAVADIALGFGIALGLNVAAGVAAFVASTAVDIGANLQYGNRSRRVEQAVVRVQSCAIRYAEANPGRGYPATYDDMGPGGSQCMDAPALALARKMNVRYVAEPAGENGVPSFAVYAHTPVADGDDIRAAGDTGGIVATSQGGSDTTRLPRGTERSVWRLAGLRNCALLSRHAGKSAGLPENLGALLRVGQQRGEHVRFLGCDKTGDTSMPDGQDAFTYEGHRFTYRLERDANGNAEHFAIEARPITYGATAVNSYLVRDTGAVHRTLSDRAATTADPVIPACTWADSLKTTPVLCAQLARPRLNPAIAFFHPTEIGPNDMFSMVVRDARDTSRGPDPSLWIGFSCQADSAHMEYMVAPPLSRSKLAHRCHLSMWDVSKPYPVLLFIRDSLGGVGWRVDTIALRPGSAPQ